MTPRYTEVAKPAFWTVLSERERYFVFAGILIVVFAVMSLFSTTPIVILMVLGPLAVLGYIGFHQLNVLLRTATSLKESEERFRLLVDEVNDYAIFAVNKDGYVVSWNAGATRITGYAAREIVGQELSLLRVEDPSHDGKQAFEIASSKGRFEKELWYLRKDGSRFLSDTVITPFSVPGADGGGFSIVMCDVTAKRQAEQELLASHQFIQRINDTIPNILFIYDLVKDQKVYLNRETASMLGYSSSEIESMGGKFFEHILHPEDLRRFEIQMDECAQQKDGDTVESEFRMKHSGGEWRLGYCRTVIFTRGQNGKPEQVLGIIQDITALRHAREHVLRLEKEAVSKQRLALVGELSAGVAHELRNPLMGIQHCIENLRAYCENDEKALATVSLLEEGLHRMDHISGRLLRLARRDEGERVPSDIAQCIDISCAFIRTRAQKAGVSLRTEIQPDIPQVTMHAERISEALLNLLNNAIDACEEGNTITVSARIDPENKDSLDLRVSDNGSGIPLEVQSKIFTAFFTTKPFGKGTGLGMTIVKKIVEAHHGTIQIVKTDVGTTFQILIPLKHHVNEGVAP